jgi:uncharacterized protein (TIGR04255 family)
MSAVTHYPHAPITEAIIDLRVQPAPSSDAARWQQVCEAVAAEYPACNQLFEAVGQFELRPGNDPAASARQSLIGYRATSVDGKQILQARRTGFTLSRLAPYDRWEPFRDEARRLWTIYREVTAPVTVIRLAVRTINRIDIPSDRVELQEYFRTLPEVSADLPQKLDGFFLQLRLPYPDLPGQALINQTIISPARPDVISVVLDIDLVRSHEPPQAEDEIWRFFEVLHDRKNDVFEACITDASRKLFGSCPS